MKTAEAVKALAALAQDTRLAIYRLLVQQGPDGLPAGTVAERLDVPAATLSFHLKELANAGMIELEAGRAFRLLLRQLQPHERLAWIPKRKLLQGEAATACAPQPHLKRKRA